MTTGNTMVDLILLTMALGALAWVADAALNWALRRLA